MPVSARHIITLCMITLPVLSHAYGNRNWLSANQFFSENSSDNTYSWGYNYRAMGRHTTVEDSDDVTNWVSGGNVRNGTSAGIYHWRKNADKPY
jgi:hypothetical protein